MQKNSKEDQGNQEISNEKTLLLKPEISYERFVNKNEKKIKEIKMSSARKSSPTSLSLSYERSAEFIAQSDFLPIGCQNGDRNRLKAQTLFRAAGVFKPCARKSRRNSNNNSTNSSCDNKNNNNNK